MTVDAALSLPCKICGAPALEVFRVPAAKKTGHAFPELPDDCPYYECTACQFCFATALDGADHTEVYDATYWDNQDPDWHGRVSETLRLVLLANALARRPPSELEVLDFGCGMGTFVETCRNKLQLEAWGTDINPPRFGREWFLPKVDRQFDIVVACEVLEHVADPRAVFDQVRAYLKPGGAFAFQTAEYAPGNGRDWWYVGPDNGHISLYSRGAFDRLYEMLRGTDRLLWRGYPGIQAWQFEPDLETRRRMTTEAALREAEHLVAAMRSSTSWLVSRPLRAIGRALGRKN